MIAFSAGVPFRRRPGGTAAFGVARRALGPGDPGGSVWPTALLAALGVLWAVSAAAQGGLFTDLYGDRRAREVGDTLHLVIQEQTTASLSAGQNAESKSDSKVGPGLGKLKFLPMLGFGGSSKSTASGSSTRVGSMTARMTVQIVEVMGNGNLVVEGQRAVNMNSDKETIRIRGEVRASDVRPDNSIYSHDLANVTIDYVGTDPRQPKRKVGIITRIINFLF